MRLLIAIICFSFSPFCILAQKLKDKKIEIHHVQLPKTLLPQSYQTYSVDISRKGLEYSGHSKEDLLKSFVLDGFKKLSGYRGQEGHLHIYFECRAFDQTDPERKELITTTKDKEGKEIKKTTYWYEIEYSMRINYSVVNPKGEVLQNNSYGESETKSSLPYESASAAYTKFKKQRNKMERNFVSSAIKSVVKVAHKNVYNEFDFHHIKVFPNYFMVKKVRTENEWEDAFENTKDLFKAMKANDPAEPVLLKMEPTIAFWKMEGSVDPAGDKKQARVYRAAHSNLAYTYFYLDQMELAKRHADLVIELERKDVRMKGLLKKIESTKKLFSIHGINTMHYYIDVAEAKSPSERKEMMDDQEDAEEDSDLMKGHIVFNNEKIEGAFLFEKGENEITLGEGGNITFVKKDGMNRTEYLLDSPEITSFALANRKFEKIKYAPSTSGNGLLQDYYREVLYSSDKIDLYKYHPLGNTTLTRTKIEYLFRLEEAAELVSFDTGKFLIFSMGLDYYFGKCTELKKMIDKDKFEKKEEDLIQLVRIFAELCTQP